MDPSPCPCPLGRDPTHSRVQWAVPWHLVVSFATSSITLHAHLARIDKGSDRVSAIVESASVCTLYIGFDFYRVIMGCPFLKVVGRQDLTSFLCPYMPHSVHPTCKLLNFLRLRVACRSVVPTVTFHIPLRIAALLSHAVERVRVANVIIKDSGFMYQLLFCGGRPMRNVFLLMARTGIPLGMTQRYWDERQRKKLITGWKRDSERVWRLHL